MNATTKSLVCVITGATGSIGRHVLGQLQDQLKGATFHVLLKDAPSFSSDSPSLFYHHVDFRVHDVNALALDQVDVVIHLATHWGSWKVAKEVNMIQTKRLFEWANQKGATLYLFFDSLYLKYRR